MDAQRWRSHLSNFVRRSENQHQEVVNHDFHVGLDVSGFGSPLAVERFLLEENQQPDEVALIARDFEGRIIRRPRPRIVLIPTPPLLPTQDMLVMAYRTLHPDERVVLAQDIALPDSPREVLPSSISSADSSTSMQSHMLPISDLKECSVCTNRRKANKFPAKVTNNCCHPSLTCLRCLEYHIANEHSTKMWDRIECPQCSQKLSYEEVKRFADTETFIHYDYLATRAALSQIPNFVWCTSCPSGQLHSPDTPSPSVFCPAVTCNPCSAVTCFNHRIPWHTGLHCRQYDSLLHPTILSSMKQLVIPSTGFKSKEEEVKVKDVEKIKLRSREHKASVKDIKRRCKPCPGMGCGTMIFKIDGCRHMTCLKCSHEFCWRCKRNWFYGHKCWKFWGVEADY